MQCHVNWNATPEQISNGIADIAVVCLTHGGNAFLYYWWFAERIIIQKER